MPVKAIGFPDYKAASATTKRSSYQPGSGHPVPWMANFDPSYHVAGASITVLPIEAKEQLMCISQEIYVALVNDR